MRVAVITPFYKTPNEWLTQCLNSVAAQTYPCTHILVSDGSPPLKIENFKGRFVQLDRPHADNGNTPRAVGSTLAIGEGFDAIAYLDADNTFSTNHIDSLVKHHQKTNAAICTSKRTLHDLDGNMLGRCTEVDGVKFADTSCLFLTRAAFLLSQHWVLMPREFSPICDAWIWGIARQLGYSTAHTSQATTQFRTSYPHHYQRLGRSPPRGGLKTSEYLSNCDTLFAKLPKALGAFEPRR